MTKIIPEGCSPPSIKHKSSQPKRPESLDQIKTVNVSEDFNRIFSPCRNTEERAPSVPPRTKELAAAPPRPAKRSHVQERYNLRKRNL